jgi:hypothetical protein
MLKFMSAIITAAAIAGGLTLSSATSTKFDASRLAKPNDTVVTPSPDDLGHDSIALVPDHSEIREFRLLTNDKLTEVVVTKLSRCYGRERQRTHSRTAVASL